MPSKTINVNTENWPTFKKYFLLAHPNQTTDKNDPVEMTDDEWIWHKIHLFCKNAVKGGKRIEAESQPPPPDDDDIVTME